MLLLFAVAIGAALASGGGSNASAQQSQQNTQNQQNTQENNQLNEQLNNQTQNQTFNPNIAINSAASEYTPSTRTEMSPTVTAAPLTATNTPTLTQTPKQLATLTANQRAGKVPDSSLPSTYIDDNSTPDKGGLSMDIIFLAVTAGIIFFIIRKRKKKNG